MTHSPATGSLVRVPGTRGRGTLATPVRFAGLGLHSGAACTVTVDCAPSGQGIAFARNGVRFAADAWSIGETTRCTSLGAAGVRVDTVEHLLAALSMLGVDDATIVVDGPEIPIRDGSALPWVEDLLRAGIERGSTVVEEYELTSTVTSALGASLLIGIPSDVFRVTCVTHYDSPLLGWQATTMQPTAESFAQDVAPARTFALAHEVEQLLRDGLALGGSLENALVVGTDGFSDTLRLPDECHRHKVLDLLGDLSLLGMPLRAHVVAVRPGHAINTAFVRCLLNGLRS